MTRRSERPWSSAPRRRAGSARPNSSGGFWPRFGQTGPVFLLHAANDYSTAPGKALAAELQRVGRPGRLMIYPPVGRTAREGHNLVYLKVPMWEAEVFSFLGEHVRN
jgi:hypothetical protein